MRRRRNSGKWTISAIKAANRAAGQHFFDADTMRFFNSKILPTVYQGAGGVFFVTSEIFEGSDRVQHKQYKVREFNPETGGVRTVGSTSATVADAKDLARAMVGSRIRSNRRRRNAGPWSIRKHKKSLKKSGSGTNWQPGIRVTRPRRKPRSMRNPGQYTVDIPADGGRSRYQLTISATSMESARREASSWYQQQYGSSLPQGTSVWAKASAKVVRRTKGWLGSMNPGGSPKVVARGKAGSRPRRGFAKAYHWWEWEGHRWPRSSSPGAVKITGTKYYGDLQNGDVLEYEGEQNRRRNASWRRTVKSTKKARRATAKELGHPYVEFPSRQKQSWIARGRTKRRVNAGQGSIRKSKKRTRAMGATHFQAGPYRGHQTKFKKFRRKPIRLNRRRSVSMLVPRSTRRTIKAVERRTTRALSKYLGGRS